MKKLKNLIYLAMAIVALITAVPQVQADVTIVGMQMEQTTGAFTLNIEASEPFVVWRKATFFDPWEQVSGVLGAGQGSWTDPDAGEWFLTTGWFPFYMVTPKGDPGNHYGEINGQATGQVMR